MAVDKLVDSSQLDTDLTSVANAIRTKGGTSASLAFPAGFVSAIGAIPTGEDREDLTSPKDVDIIDFDGRLLYSYTAAEFLALTELPPNPSYPGLVAQGWNWTLADAKAYVQEWGALVIGQSYVTDDGKTRAYVHITDAQVAVGAPLFVKLQCIESGGGTIDWGDESTTTITSSTGIKSFSHVYSASGDYVVKIELTSGAYSLGVHQSSVGAFGNAANNAGESRCLESVTKVEIGSRITGFGRQPFHGCGSLESVSIPTTLTAFSDNSNTDGAAFESAAMKGVVFPTGFQGKSNTMFKICSLLRYVAAPKSMTSFSFNSTSLVALRKLTLAPQSVGTTSTVKLNYVRNLTHLIMPGDYTTLASVTVNGSMIKKFVIPATVTVIQIEALIYNYYLEELHVLPTAVPTLNNVRALNGLGPNSVIYVPYSPDHSILAAYKAATNWSTFASYMQEEPQ